jgi:hypothetical protein
VEQNREAGQNPPRVVAPCEEEEEYNIVTAHTHTHTHTHIYIDIYMSVCVFHESPNIIHKV